MDKKQREEFDSTLNSGVGEQSWANVEARAWQRLQDGEFEDDPDDTEGGGK